MTEQEYIEDLAALTLLDPAHILLNRLREGFSVPNKYLLIGALKKAREIAESVVIEEVVIEVDCDDFLKGLYNRKSTLFCDRRKLSNTFHTCKSDRERADVSDNIQGVQRNIEQVMRDIKIYQDKGMIEVQEKYPVPADPLKRQLLIQSLRSSISRKRKEIADLKIRVGDGLPGIAEKLNKCEFKLQDLTTHLEHAEAP